MIELNAFATV